MEQLKPAIETLYSFRLSNDLEDGIMTVMGFRDYPESEYEMCSAETKILAQTYIDYNLEFNGPRGPYIANK